MTSIEKGVDTEKADSLGNTHRVRCTKMVKMRTSSPLYETRSKMRRSASNCVVHRY